jgi:hypothetical protein
MYGLPEDFDGSTFVGHVLEVVAFAENAVYLTFDRELSISIESCFEYCSGNSDSPVEQQRVPVKASAVMQLIGRTVLACEAERNGTLTLHFEGGQVFRCIDDQVQYESYRITNGKHEIFI